MDKNKKKKLILIVSIVVIFLLGILFFIHSILKDQEETAATMNLILKDYDQFEDRVLNFNDKRDQIYSSIFVETYYDTIKVNYGTWNLAFQEYEKEVDRVLDVSKNLKKYCNGVYYSKSDVNKKCNSFSSLYEEVINTFVSDVSSYNKIIDNYNDYVKENGGTDLLEKYSTTKKYVDYNQDKKYSGKE